MRCRIDRIFLNYRSRRRHNDRPANHDGLGNEGSRLCDNDGRRKTVLVRLNFRPIAWNLGKARLYWQIGGHYRRRKS
jgi:hypothetical protein